MQVLRQLDPQRTWHKAQAFARRVVSDMRHQLRDADLVTLRPKQRWQQLSHAVLLHGTLVQSERSAGVNRTGLCALGVSNTSASHSLLSHELWA